MRVEGGLIDRARPLNFTFNGKGYTGYHGDTLASALLANGVRLVGRSFKYHRPRGIFSAGSEEPNALVQIGEGAWQEPNTKTTTVPLFDGLTASSQNHLGSLENDLMAFNDRLSRFLTAGFYYKTFMWPRSFWERFYEPLIRRAAGLGALSGADDPSRYERGHLHCDVLVVGGGPTGLSAAREAAALGARVILADEDSLFGGRLNSERENVEGQAGYQWARQTTSTLASAENVRLMPRTTVFGAYDHGVYGALEVLTDDPKIGTEMPRQIYWRINARRVILCSGATERSIAFANNDRPGIMLAGGARTYANRFAVLPGRRVAILGADNEAAQTAEDLKAAGAEIVATLTSAAESTVADTQGRRCLSAIKLADGRKVECDTLAVCGGWNPNIQLTSHHRSKPVWNDEIDGFVPGEDLPPGMIVAGAARGVFDSQDCLADGAAAAALSLSDIAQNAPVEAQRPRPSVKPVQIKTPAALAGSGRAWVDLQNDVTAKDLFQAQAEGFKSVEHMKRYTTLGMATDQGRTSNSLALRVLGQAYGVSPGDLGTTLARPPYNPVAIGAFAGPSRGQHCRPTRRTPSHAFAEGAVATFVETGAWLRAQWYAQDGETHWRQSVDREVNATRNGVGICDVTTLGKIEVTGADAAAFLDFVYANTMSTLKIGRTRYGLMLREDGFVMDDGTCARLADEHYVVTTTTANAVSVFRHLEFVRQCLRPHFDVHLISSTEQWAQFAVAGPRSRDLLQRLVNTDLSNEAFPFMACGPVDVLGVPGRLFRISFSGELAYEIAVPTRYGNALFAKLLELGADLDATPYGTEALGVMRIEKGHAAGNELNGTTTALNLGLGRMVSSKKDCIGSVLSKRPEMVREDGLRLVGFIPTDRERQLTAGAHFLEPGAQATMENDLGWMSSVAYSPTLGQSIGLGFLMAGTDRLGERLTAWDELRGTTQEVEVTSPHFVDPDGTRLKS